MTNIRNNNICSFCGKIIEKTYYKESDRLQKIISCSKYSCKIKLGAKCRNKDLDPKSNTGKGYISEALVAKFLDIRTCFDITGIFNHPGYDLFEHEDWGMINVKSSSLLGKKNYRYHKFNIFKNSRCNFFFLIGYDEERKHVIAVYIIPNEDYMDILTAICIPFNVDSEWNFFKENEEEVKKWDELFHSMKLDDCPVLMSDKLKKNIRKCRK